MTSPAAIKSEIESARPPVPITITTEGSWTADDLAKAIVERVKDHPSWDLVAKWGEDNCEPRRMPERVLSVGGDQSARSKKYDWKTHWDWSKEGLSTNDLEIYGVLRAEHQFHKWGWTKVNSKMGNHGIDNLFKRGDEFALCESKAGGTPAAVRDYVKYLQMHPKDVHSNADWSVCRRRVDMVKKRLEGHGVQGSIPDMAGLTFPDEHTETYLYAMTRMWVNSRIAAMIKVGGQLGATAGELREARKKNKAFRYFNFYAAVPLFALPGVYQIGKGRAAEFSASKKERSPKEKVFDWPDNASRLEREFIWLDFHLPFIELEEKNEELYEEEVGGIGEALDD